MQYTTRFVRLPVGLYVPKNVVRVICTVRSTISYRVNEGTFLCNQVPFYLLCTTVLNSLTAQEIRDMTVE